MALTFKFYNDTGLTDEFTSPLQTVHNADGSTGPVIKQLYIGSINATKTLQANSNPGVDQIVLSVGDSDPGNNHETTEVKLALSQVGLDSATGGAALNLGLSISGGVGNQLPVWISVEDATQTVGTITELSVLTNALQES